MTVMKDVSMTKSEYGAGERSINKIQDFQVGCGEPELHKMLVMMGTITCVRVCVCIICDLLGKKKKSAICKKFLELVQAVVMEQIFTNYC